MQGEGTAAELEWRDGAIPVSRRFDDPYFSLAGGLEETRHVFLDGNDLPARLRDGFHIAELGFGTGLNLLATLELWRRLGLPGRLRYTSFEAFPMRAADMARALSAFPELAGLAADLAGAAGFADADPASIPRTEFPTDLAFTNLAFANPPGDGASVAPLVPATMPTGGSHRGASGRSDNGLAPRPEPGETQTPTSAAPTPAAPTPAAPTSAAPTPAALCSFALGPADITVILGDARQTLPQWQGQADAWYLDGFSPARNPELWSPELLAEVARHTRPHGSFATYTAAGQVRRALQAAGFQVERRPGYGQKRHMTRGSLGAP